jgi:putative tricarboxylic transport membrane protein
MDKDVVFGGATLAISATYYWLATAIPSSQLADAIGPQGLPKVYAILLAALSLIVIGRSMARRADAQSHAAATAARRASRPALWRVAGMLAIGVVYIVIAPWLGYTLSIAGLILATTYYQGGSVTRRVAIVAASGALFFWLLFVVLMRIPQPLGWWPSLS